MTDKPPVPPKRPRKARAFGQSEQFRFVILIAEGFGYAMAAREMGFDKKTVWRAAQANPEFSAAIEAAREEQVEIAREQQASYGPLALNALVRALRAEKPNPILVMFTLQNARPDLFQDRRTQVHEFKTLEERTRFLEEATGKSREELLALAVQGDTKH